MPIFNTILDYQEENAYKELTITSNVYNIINESYTTVRYRYGKGSSDYYSPEYAYGFSVSEIPENVKQIIIIQKEGTGKTSESSIVIAYFDVENKTVHTIKNSKKTYNDYYSDVDCAFFYVDSNEYKGHTTVKGNTYEFEPESNYVGKYVFVFTGPSESRVYYPRVFVKC